LIKALEGIAHPSKALGLKHFGIKRKLEPRYVLPYRIIEKSGGVAYKLNLPRELGAIFLGFHVS
jgi:hypothetical protein